MAVSIRYAGRLGNNIFQYSIARLFAEKNDLVLETPWPWPDWVQATPCASGARELGAYGPQPSLYFNDEVYPNFKMKYPPGNYVFTDGYFQDVQYYEPHRDQIRDFFRFPLASFSKDKISLDYRRMVRWSELPQNTEDLGIHHRLTDNGTISRGCIIDRSWFEKILDMEARKHRRVVVFTEDPHAHGQFDVFKSYNAIIKSQTVPADFIEMMTYENFVMGTSTFSWWTCFLGHAKNVIQFPRMIDLPAVKLQLSWARQVEGRYHGRNE